MDTKYRALLKREAQLRHEFSEADAAVSAARVAYDLGETDYWPVAHACTVRDTAAHKWTCFCNHNHWDLLWAKDHQ